MTDTLHTLDRSLTFARELAVVLAGALVAAHHALDHLRLHVHLRAATLRTVRLRAGRRALLHQVARQRCAHAGRRQRRHVLLLRLYQAAATLQAAQATAQVAVVATVQADATAAQAESATARHHAAAAAARQVCQTERRIAPHARADRRRRLVVVMVAGHQRRHAARKT